MSVPPSENVSGRDHDVTLWPIKIPALPMMLIDWILIGILLVFLSKRFEQFIHGFIGLLTKCVIHHNKT
ncbi:MAG: hypothetical protein IPL23_10945 [Saprospiraceae bacterium]|nr:hypothetical protein [Saprospiraceae bacterium]